ncbi:MAG: MoaD/ThiS family protein [Chloroflexota bacterium]
MKVEAVFFAQLREMVGVRQKHVELPAGARVRDLVDLLARQHGDNFRDEIKNLEGTRILIGDREYFPDEVMDTRLKDGDQVVFLPPIFGG